MSLQDDNKSKAASDKQNIEIEFMSGATDKKTDESIQVAIENSKDNDVKNDEDDEKIARLKKMFKSPKALSPKYKLATDPNYRRNSMFALQFVVLSSAISSKMLAPNYAIMCSPDHPDSFPSTAPFGFNAATYFIPMMSLLGITISSIFVGPISDKIGRKIPILVMSVFSIAGCLTRYYTRYTFWGFCTSSLLFGFFLGNLPIGMAYIGEVYTDKLEKQKQIGILVGCYVLGASGGGIIAILMKDEGLFSPLWVGAGLMVVSSLLVFKCLIEPGDIRLVQNDNKLDGFKDDEKVVRPEKINNKVMWNIIIGALADNFGSTGLFPMCLSPLALEQFNFQFTELGLDPILSIGGYQWMSVCVALLVIPSTMITPYFFAKIGTSGCCVFGNVFTGILTMILLLLGGYAPATGLTFGFFVFVMYAGFPFTVFSQLTTGPMLDAIAPEDKLGYVQGLNNSAMNFGMAVAPWLFGILADATSTNISIWIGVGLSFLAAVINAPLMWRPEMGPSPKPLPYDDWFAQDEAANLAEGALFEEHVPPALLFQINRKRGIINQPSTIPRIKTYAEDKEHLDALRANAIDNYRFRHDLGDQVLAELSAPNGRFDAQELSDVLNSYATSANFDPEAVSAATADVGQWIADYMKGNGYFPPTNSLLIKQMIMSAFPPITTENKVTPENIEDVLIRGRYILGKYRDLEERKYGKYSLFEEILGKGQRPQFYT